MDNLKVRSTPRNLIHFSFNQQEMFYFPYKNQARSRSSDTKDYKTDHSVLITKKAIKKINLRIINTLKYYTQHFNLNLVILLASTDGWLIYHNL